jgi:cell division protein FtsB
MTRQQMPDTASDSWPSRVRPRFTSRAAVLVVVVCAIALSLAYPVREYIAQIRQIDQLEVQQAKIAAQVQHLKVERRELAGQAYVEQQARDRLHMCFPVQTCYEISSGSKPAAARVAPGHRVVVTPWYERLWSSVHEADKASSP